MSSVKKCKYKYQTKHANIMMKNLQIQVGVNYVVDIKNFFWLLYHFYGIKLFDSSVHWPWCDFGCNQGHQDFVNCLAVSPSGNFVVSGSHDRSVRLWEKSDEILVLSEERETVGCFI